MKDKVTRSLIRKYADQVARQYHPNKVILFGPYVYGKPHEDSDVDLLVSMPFAGSGEHKATEKSLAAGPEFSIDLPVRRPEQIRARTKAGDFFLREITEKGKVIYEAAHA
jgi:predicted nucleotidyltransferase